MNAGMTPDPTLCGATVFRTVDRRRRGGNFFALNRVNFVNLESLRAIFLNETAFALAPPAPIRNCAAHD